MTRPASASPDRPDALPTAVHEDLEVERLAAEGWPVLRGSAAQRDARFVKLLLKAQLAASRRGR